MIILYLAGVAISLAMILSWCAWYTTKAERGNGTGMPWQHFLGIFAAPDTTGSAYARQTKEHAQENDRHAQELMAARRQETPVVVEQTVTQTKTGG